MSAWGCPHEREGACSRVLGRPCDPGMKGCILAGRFHFSNEAKAKPRKRRTPEDAAPPAPGETEPEAPPED